MGCDTAVLAGQSALNDHGPGCLLPDDGHHAEAGYLMIVITFATITTNRKFVVVVISNLMG